MFSFVFDKSLEIIEKRNTTKECRACSGGPQGGFGIGSADPHMARSLRIGLHMLSVGLNYQRGQPNSGRFH